MNIDIRTDHGITLVTPHAARLDASTAPALRAALLDRIAADDSRILLDLSGVTFLDSSALGALIAAAKRFKPSGDLCVAGLQPAVARLFALTHMDRIFTVYPDTTTALALLST